jgi:hypothetical protein
MRNGHYLGVPCLIIKCCYIIQIEKPYAINYCKEKGKSVDRITLWWFYQIGFVICIVDDDDIGPISNGMLLSLQKIYRIFIKQKALFFFPTKIIPGMIFLLLIRLGDRSGGIFSITSVEFIREYLEYWFFVNIFITLSNIRV